MVSGFTIKSLKELPKNLKCFPKESNSKESGGSGRVILELTGRVEGSRLLVYAILWLTEAQLCLLWNQVLRGKRTGILGMCNCIKHSEICLSVTPLHSTSLLTFRLILGEMPTRWDSFSQPSTLQLTTNEWVN